MVLEITRIVQKPIGTNCYVISDGTGSIVIDPGSEVDLAEIKEAIVGKLHAVVLTHLHYDHSAAAHLFDAPVYIHKDELQDLELQKQLGVQGLGKELILPDEFEFLEEKMSFGEISFEVIHTPGHTKGGVCLLFSNFVITGDTLFDRAYGRTDIGGNQTDIVLSLLRLMQINPNYVFYPGHGEPSTIGEQKHWIVGNDEEE